MRILYIRLPLLFFYAHVDVVIDLKHVNTAAARWAVGEPRAGRDAGRAALLRADGVRRAAEHASRRGGNQGAVLSRSQKFFKNRTPRTQHTRYPYKFRLGSAPAASQRELQAEEKPLCLYPPLLVASFFRLSLRCCPSGPTGSW